MHRNVDIVIFIRIPVEEMFPGKLDAIGSNVTHV